jgi:hypothetical protein
MDPGTMMLLASIVPAFLNLGGSDAKKSSSFSKGQKGGINDILQAIKGQQGNMDITQSPQYQQGNEWLMSMFNDPEFFKSFEAPLQRQFQEETVPGLANRFASMGSGGSLGSTGFRNQLAREGSNLSTNIAALRGGMQQSAIPQLFNSSQMPFQNIMQMYQQALGQPVNNQYMPATNPTAPIAGAGLQGFMQGYGMNYGKGKNNAGEHPSTGYMYPLTQGYDTLFRHTGVF